MDILIIDSGIVEHKTNADVNIRHTGFRGQDNYKAILDVTGHGTAVAGLIAKDHKDLNVHVLKLFNHEYECTIEDLIEALDYISQHNTYDIINMSFGVTTFDEPGQIIRLEQLCDTIKAQGSILVAAFDNDGAISYPACFGSVIGVDVSNNSRNRNEYEYMENSIITVRGYGANQKVAWKDPEYTIIGGTSFACANVSGTIVTMLINGCEKRSIHAALKQNAIQVQKFNPSSPPPAVPAWLNGARAIIVPVNKEIQSLIAFESLLTCSIVGVYDFKYTSRIGKNVSEILSYRNTSPYIVQNYETIDWESNTFDIVIAGYLQEMSWRCKRDLLKEIIERCGQYKKKLYTFDNLTPYMNTIRESGIATSDCFYPYIKYEHIPKGRLGKLYDVISPVVAVIGTSSQQGKFTIQLDLRERLQQKGYRVGQIGSEPSSYCFGMDYVFPYGYQSTVEANGFECIQLLNEMIHEIGMRGVDICIVGTQSGTVPYSNCNLATIPLHQVEFLLGTYPDAFILCVNPHDEMDYIKRTLNGVEAYFECKCIAIVIYPLEQQQMLGGLYKKVNIAKTERYLAFKKALSGLSNVPVIDMDDALTSDRLMDCVVDFFVSE